MIAYKSRLKVHTKLGMDAPGTGLTGTGVLCGCAAHSGYDRGSAGGASLIGNSQSFAATTDQMFKTAMITLIQQGFTLEQADVENGLIKGVRLIQDPKQPNIAYLLTTIIDVTGAPGNSTVVTASASQPTVIHKDRAKHPPLPGRVPNPAGKDYQPIVRREGNITDPAFYQDLFAAIAANLPELPALTTSAVPSADSRVSDAAAVDVAAAIIAARQDTDAKGAANAS